MLVERGANVNARDFTESTVLDYALGNPYAAGKSRKKHKNLLKTIKLDLFKKKFQRCIGI